MKKYKNHKQQIPRAGHPDTCLQRNENTLYHDDEYNELKRRQTIRQNTAAPSLKPAHILMHSIERHRWEKTKTTR